MEINIFKKFLSLGLICSLMFSSVAFANSSEPSNDKAKNGESFKSLKRNLFFESLEELKEEKVLSKEDVDNIHKYLKTSMNQRKSIAKKDIKNSTKPSIPHTRNTPSNKFVIVDALVKDNIITKEQGDKLKETLQNNWIEIKNRGKI